MPAVQTWSRTSSRIAFLKYFAIAVGERVRRLVTVEPGRHPQRVGALPEPLAYVDRARDPVADRRLVGRHRGERLEGLAQGAVVVAGQVGAEVRRLHGTRAATRRHRQPGRGQRPSQPGGVGVAGAVAGQRVTAHHPDDPAPCDDLLERVVDSQVVQGLGGRTTPLWYCPMTTLRADTPGCFPRTASGSLETSDRPTARTWTGRR